VQYYANDSQRKSPFFATGMSRSIAPPILPQLTSQMEFSPERSLSPELITFNEEFEVELPDPPIPGALNAAEGKRSDSNLPAHSTRSRSHVPREVSPVPSDTGESRGLISIPEGEASRPGRGGYNLKKALCWDTKDFNNMKVITLKIL
jgi:hypothetical protein